MELSVDTFRPRIGDTFPLELEDGGEVELELVEVEEAGPEASRAAAAAGLRQPFSILFRGPLDPLVPQGTYAVSQNEIGSFELFIVPIGQDARGTQYQAVFA
jgi:hypothetical protein